MSNLLRMENIKKSFDKASVDEVKVFNDFSLSIEEGEFVSVIGSNGSGKTTLLNIISGNIKIDSGEIYLRDEKISEIKEYLEQEELVEYIKIHL